MHVTWQICQPKALSLTHRIPVPHPDAKYELGQDMLWKDHIQEPHSMLKGHKLDQTLAGATSMLLLRLSSTNPAHMHVWNTLTT